VITKCTTSLTFSNSAFSPHRVFMCFVWIWEQTAIISLYSINWLVCITETESIYCAVRTGSLYIIQVMCFVWISEQRAIISLYSINWLVYITVTDCVYCAVRTGSLYIIQVDPIFYPYQDKKKKNKTMMMMMMTNAPLYTPPLLRYLSLSLSHSVFNLTAKRSQQPVTEQHYKCYTPWRST